MKKFHNLGDKYEDFESLYRKCRYRHVLGTELWESEFYGLLSLVNIN